MWDNTGTTLRCSFPKRERVFLDRMCDMLVLRMADAEVAVPTPVHPVTPPRRVPKPKNSAERKARLDQIIREFDRLFPTATCALQHKNPWQLLVATILSAQCTDERVNRLTP